MKLDIRQSNMLGGVSQQAAAQQFPSQCKELTNGYPSIVDGLSRRPPTQHVGRLIFGEHPESHFHYIDRDQDERYIVVVGSGSIQVFDLEGNAKTVHSPDGLDYLECDSPRTQLKALTLADYTFIVNTTVDVEKDEDSAPTVRNPEALVFVKQGAYSTTYTITGSAGAYSDSTTTGASAGDANTESIAAALADAVVAGFTVTRSGSVIWIRADGSDDFSMTVNDGIGNTGLVLVKDSVQTFDDLPTTAPHGFVVRIAGDPSAKEDDYYLKFEADNGDFGSGKWVESVAPKMTDGSPIQNEIDPDTMPHVLIRMSNGEFVFKRGDGSPYGSEPKTDFKWEAREVGDEFSNPDPNFIGTRILNLALNRTRLMFMSPNGQDYSEVSVFGNFWRTTVTTLLDSDPISDSLPSDGTIHTPRSTGQIAQKLVVFADRAQFIVSGNPTLTPKTISTVLSTTYEVSPSASPLSVAGSILFPTVKGTCSGVREFLPVQQDASLFTAPDITDHVPHYIRGNIVTMAASTVDGALIVVTDEGPWIYLYKWYISPDSGDKVQSAWSRWEFGSGTTVVGAYFFDSTLYLLMSRSTGLFLEKMVVIPSQTDTLADDESEDAEFVTYLDRRITDEDCTSISYDASADETTIELPYTIQTERDMVVAIRPSSDNGGGRSVPIVSSAGSTIVARGDLTDEFMFIGEAWSHTYTFSTQIVRRPTASGGQVPVLGGRLQINYGRISATKCGYFKVRVNDYEYEFSGINLDTESAELDEPQIHEEAEFRFPVYGRNDQVEISIVNDSFFPAHFQSAEFECWYTRGGVNL